MFDDDDSEAFSDAFIIEETPAQPEAHPASRGAITLSGLAEQVTGILQQYFPDQQGRAIAGVIASQFSFNPTQFHSYYEQNRAVIDPWLRMIDLNKVTASMGEEGMGLGATRPGFGLWVGVALGGMAILVAQKIIKSAGA